MRSGEPPRNTDRKPLAASLCLRSPSREILHRIQSSTFRGWAQAEGTVREGGETMIANQCRSFWFGLLVPRFSLLAAGAVGAVGNAGFIGVFQVLWKGAASSRLYIGRQLP